MKSNWSMSLDKTSLWVYTPWFFLNFYFPIRHSSFRLDRHDVLSDFHFDLTFARISFEFSLRDDDRAGEVVDFACSIFQNILDPESEQLLQEFDQFCKSRNEKKFDQSC